jgi:hypothetical protein
MRTKQAASPRGEPGYDLPVPNSGLPFRGRLPDYNISRRGHRAGRGICEVDGQPLETFASPVLLERAMRRDPVLRKIADEVLAAGPIRAGGKREAAAVGRLRRRFVKTTAVVVAADVCSRLEEVADDAVKYYLAFRAAELTHPGRFESPDEEERDESAANEPARRDPGEARAHQAAEGQGGQGPR